MENSTPTPAQEQPIVTEQVQAENPTPTPASAQTFDSSDAIAAIRAQREGKPTEAVQAEQPKAEPVAQEQPKVEATPEVKTEQPAFNAETYLSETTKGAYKTPEELTAALDNLKNPYSLLSEHEQKILEVFKQHGENPQEYFVFQQQDFKAMDAQEVLRQNFLKANSDLDSELAEAAFQRDLLNKYPHLDSEDAESIDYRLNKKEMEREADKLRTDLIKQQEESRIKLPEPKQEEQPDPALYEKYLESAKASLTDFNEMKIQVDENGSEITVGITGKEELEKALANPLAYVESRWINQDGSYNFNQLRQDLHFLANRKSVDAALYEAGKEAGTKQFVDETLKHPTPLQPSLNHPSDNGVEEARAVIRQRNQNNNSTI